MKRLLGIVAVALFVAVPVFGQDPTITYTLQLGGNNGVDLWEGTPAQVPVFDTTGITVAPGTYAVPAGTNVITWSVAVAASGAKDSVAIGGIANLVWNLKLHAGSSTTDPLVGPEFGLGNASAAGFFSTINDGDDTGHPGDVDPVEPAAFPWVFNVNESTGNKGRIFDTVPDNGPHFAQYTYPSTFEYYYAPQNTPPIGPITDGTVTAVSGTLMGMGAGYTDYNWTGGLGDERGGVGLGTTATCYQNIGDKPVAEGQINITGLPAGTYTLELVPGTGNNVLWPESICGSGTAGAFAVGVATANVTGSTIHFTITPPANPPVLQAAVSNKVHVGSTDPWPLALNLTGTATSEPRSGGPVEIVATYDVNIAGAISVTGAAVTATGTTSLTPTWVASNNKLTITLTGVPDVSCVTLTIHGVASATTGAVADDHAVMVRACQGDVNNSGSVSGADINAIRPFSTGDPIDATSFKYDINLSGSVSGADINAVRPLSTGVAVPTCTYP